MTDHHLFWLDHDRKWDLACDRLQWMIRRHSGTHKQTSKPKFEGFAIRHLGTRNLLIALCPASVGRCPAVKFAISVVGMEAEQRITLRQRLEHWYVGSKKRSLVEGFERFGIKLTAEARAQPPRTSVAA